MIMGLGIPVTMILLTELVRVADQNGSDKRNRMDWLMALKGISFFLFGVMVTEAFTEVIKHSIGRLRPNFFDVCKPEFNNINCSTRYITEYTCMNTEFSEREIRESRLSFPSGHASFGMFCAVYTALYLQARFLFGSSVLTKPTLQAGLVLVAVWCGMTRITDHKHFSADVVTGFTLGTIVAWLVFYKVAWLSLRTVRFTLFPRSFSVSSNSEPQTPDPLLRESTNQFNVYLDDPMKVDRSKSLV
ncbi:phospholipid phosphatase 3-like [Gigantopelta aegis]|uniref:phospholipid phosphatase 3-like n=1 Tax=Gigantopelta aegis TaxID=1735272 RepID=UPI001B88D360|nr:phospholipid phosphatase 3-like [Gigantopelta aegis]